MAFAKFEEENKEVERARAIFRFGLDKVPRGLAAPLFAAYAALEKQHGDAAGIEMAIAARARMKLEDDLKREPRNYDAWLDYARLEERHGRSPAAAREVYERAVAQTPPTSDKRHWRRYVWLWIGYAVFEELDCEEPDNARAVWTACLQLLRTRKLSFCKIWVHFAQFEMRQGQLAAARKLLGTAIGEAPKPKLFRA